MTPKDNDTDPSTPSARRPSPSRGSPTISAATAETPAEGSPSFESGGAGAESAVLVSDWSAGARLDGSLAARGSQRPPSQTDPGVGPPAPVRTLTPKPVGVVVPSPARGTPLLSMLDAAAMLEAASPRPPAASVSVMGSEAAPRFPGTTPRPDSVELLLDGIAGPRPDRSRTTPQTAGQGAAAYHAEHGLRSANSNSAGAVGSVLVERPPTPREIPIASAAALRAARLNAERNDPTVLSERVLARRLGMALGGGVLVVALLFVLVHFAGSSAAESSGGSIAPSSVVPASAAKTTAAPAVFAPPAATTAAAPAATVAAAPAADPISTPELTAVVGSSGAASERSPSSVAEPQAPDPNAQGSSSARAPVLPGGPNLVHKRRRILATPAAGGAASAGDVGEFKTKF